MFLRLLLILVSLLVILLQNSDSRRSLRIDDPELFSVVAVDDKHNGGRSRARIKKVDDKWRLNCTIKKSDYAYPYCEIRFIPEDNLGVDFSIYDEVIIAAKYRHQPNNSKHSFRFQMRNFNPSYSNKMDENSLKYNAIEYRLGDEYPITIPYNRMQVLSWWITNNKIPMEEQGFEVNDVRFLELATGNFITPGKYIIDVEKIEFRGKWISDATAYLALVMMWVAFSIVFLLEKTWRFSRNVRHLKKQKQEVDLKNILLESKQKELQDKAHRDPLTGVLNRAGLDHFIKKNDSILSHEQHLCILYLDLDHFKLVNDNHGHQTGDDVLINFANIIELQTRDSDLFVRWGGEEFVLVCPNTVLEQAILLAEKLRTSVEMAHWPERLDIRMSIGVAQMHNESIDQLMERADQALYRAKEKGRNRVEVAS